MNTQELLKAQEWRASIKKFDASKKIPQDIWQALEKSLILTPSSFGLQPWKFFVIQDIELRKKLTPLSWNQTQVEDCSHFVVFTYRNTLDEAFIERYVEDIAKTRSQPLEKLKGYKSMMVETLVKGPQSAQIPEWSKKQVYIALGNFMTSAALLGVDTCPMEGIDPVAYDKTLGLTGSEYTTVVTCAAGYRHAEDAYSKQAKVRFPAKDLIVTI
jgi:nitroreductase